MCDNKYEMVAGKYVLEIEERYPGKMWITGPDGDGGQFNIKESEALTAEYFKENF